MTNPNSDNEATNPQAWLLAAEPLLDEAPLVVVTEVTRHPRPLRVALTARLRNIALRERLWRSPAFCQALRNVQYGFDPRRRRSGGGRDGIFLLDRDFRPATPMQRKLFDQYLDDPRSGVAEVADALGCAPEQLLGARLVAHKLRLLGVLAPMPSADWLVLVDLDVTRRV